MRRLLSLLFLSAFLVPALVQAQSTRPAAPSTRPTARPADDDDIADRLAPRFTSRVGAISFRPPLGGTVDRRISENPDLVARFTDGDEKWSLLVSRKFFSRPTKLVGVDDPRTANIDESKTDPGVVDALVTQLRTNDVNAQLLRQQKTQVSGRETGFVALRFTNAKTGQVWFRQHAVIQVNDQLFYIFDFTTPSTWTTEDKDVDPAEKIAADLFDLIIDSVEMLDWRPLLAERDDRLFRTRAMLVNLPAKIEKSVEARTQDVPEDPVPHAQTYLLLQKDGKDVGYGYLAEWIGSRAGEKGVFVASLIHKEIEKGTVVETASEMFSELKSRQAREEWMSVTRIDKDKQTEHFSEYGSSKVRRGVVRDDAEGTQAVGDRKEPERAMARTTEFHTLEVRQISRGGARPITRDLPQYYVPVALANQLPRMLPLHEPKGYLIAAWEGGIPAVVLRYLDVEAVREIRFAGTSQKLITVRERLGLEGDPTLHYFSEDGRYIGSITESLGMSMVVTTEAVLKKTFPDARLGRPQLLTPPKTEAPRSGNP